MIDPLSSHIPLDSVGPALPVYPTRKLLVPSADHPDDYILELDYSSLSNYMVCPRRFENYSIRSREAAKEQTATLRGSLFHSLEETRLRHGFSPAVEQKQKEMIAEHFLQYPGSHTDFRSQSFLMDTITKYNKTYGLDGLDKKILQINGEPFVERPFKIPLTTIAVYNTLPYTFDQVHINTPHFKERCNEKLFVRNLHILYTGKIDAVLSESTLLWVMDHKTSSRGGAEFFDYFRLSLQTRGYCWAVQKLLGREVAGLIMNAIVWRAPTKTGKGTEMTRPTYFYSQDSLAEWEDDMKSHCENLVSSLVRGFFPQVSLSFKSPCIGCDYAENCGLPRHQRSADLSSDLYRNVTWNPIH